MPEILHDPWAYIAVAAIGFIGYVGRLAASGKWYHHTVVERELAAAAEANDLLAHDRDEWRTESRIKDQQIAERDTQLAHTREIGELIKMQTTEIRELARERRRDGEVTT